MSYPKMLYNRRGLWRIVASAAALATLGPAWQESPAHWGLITAPSAAQSAANARAARGVLGLFPNAQQLTADTVARTDRRVRPATLGF